MKRIEPALVVLALIAGCGAAQPRSSDSPEPPRAEPTTSATPPTPSREAVARAMNSVSGAVAACGRGMHGEVSVALVFDSSGAVTDSFVNPEYSWAARQPGPGCDSTPDAYGYHRCRSPHTPVPEVDDCILRAVRAARVPPFSRPTFRVNYPFRY